MRILVFANTPAHVHLYRHAVSRLESRGHEVLVLGRDYACTRDLLEFFDLPHRIYGEHGTETYSRLKFASEIASQFGTIARTARGFRPDVVFGRGPYAAFAGTLARAPVVLVLDDEPGDFNYAVSRPFADCILSPAATNRDLGDAHRTFDGFKECAYLHPDVFEPAGDVRDRLGVDPDEPFVILRFNALDALHDVVLEGFTRDQRGDLIRRLSEHATVFVSDEGQAMDFEDLPARPYDLHPARIHDALAEASLLIADTGTMVTEAGLLGTPAIRYRGNDDHEYGEFDALERAGLADQFDEYETARDRALELLSDPDAKRRWRRRRESSLDRLVNLTDLIVDVAESRGDPEGRSDLLEDRPASPIASSR
ncbi:DUF354 domain-containing protein [Natrialbaceae archaeon GCM10025810]|uniref:DUF354 domain-containing protein n=1 Tax=Halovalidus salilacus TaxID=3075124 RepID=UPI003611254B